MAKTVQITEHTHKDLDVFRAQHVFRTFDQAIMHLLKTHDKKVCDDTLKTARPKHN